MLPPLTSRLPARTPPLETSTRPSSGESQLPPTDACTPGRARLRGRAHDGPLRRQGPELPHVVGDPLRAHIQPEAPRPRPPGHLRACASEFLRDLVQGLNVVCFFVILFVSFPGT